MIGHAHRRLQTAWHLWRRRFGAHPEVPRRLVVQKAQWPQDAQSPVTLAIDDLTNAWHNRQGGERWEPGGDWGGGLWQPGSALSFLEERLLRDFPEARTTFYTVAGAISAYTRHQPFSHAQSLDASAESRQFFRSLAEDPRFELAYHGYDHGTAGVTTEGFVQEWRGFASVEAAVARTRQGLAIFERATGRQPTGGKYGGWDYNRHAEEALDRLDFLWWCRDWMPRDVVGRVPDAYYEVEFFGSRGIAALPTTVHGRFWDRRQLELLLARRQYIAIEEHIAPLRPDGRVQTPNIIDDIDDLRRLYAWLRTRRVWHATAGEVAAYVLARTGTSVHDTGRDGFALRYQGPLREPRLTLCIDASAIASPGLDGIAVTLPDGSVLPADACRRAARPGSHVVTLPVQDGHYGVRAIPLASQEN